MLVADAGDDSASSANLHKQLLAQEVVKVKAIAHPREHAHDTCQQLRREVAQLRASGGGDSSESSHVHSNLQ